MFQPRNWINETVKIDDVVVKVNRTFPNGSYWLDSDNATVLVDKVGWVPPTSLPS